MRGERFQGAGATRNSARRPVCARERACRQRRSDSVGPWHWQRGSSIVVGVGVGVSVVGVVFGVVGSVVGSVSFVGSLGTIGTIGLCGGGGGRVGIGERSRSAAPPPGGSQGHQGL